MVLAIHGIDDLDLDSPEFDLDEEPLTPEDGDLITTDYERFYADGRLAFAVADDEDMEDAIRAYMSEENFWPNVWHVSDHGNCCLIEF